MTYFRVVGESALSSQPIEKTFSSAVQAEAECGAMRRLCGRYGKVDVWGKDGRRITPERLHTLAMAEAGDVPPAA